MTSALGEGSVDRQKHYPRIPEVAVGRVSALDSTNRARHRWYFVKEAFSPDIVTTAINDAKCEDHDIVVDPFCGSGTVPLQAAIHGRQSRCIEVNPFLAFVARTKLSQCRPQSLKSHAEKVLKRATHPRRSPLEGYSTFSKTRGISKWLFNTSVLRAFESGYAELSARSAQSDLLKLCLIGAAMDNANAVKDGKCLRYRSDWDERHFDAESFRNSFESRVKMIVQDLEEVPLNQRPSCITRGDARKKRFRMPGTQGFKLCLTSPPYLNSFDYTDVYRPELFLGRWVTTRDGLRRMRQHTLRSHVQAEWKDPTADDFGPLYAASIEELRAKQASLWNQRIPLMVQAYFEDMRKVLTSLRKQAAPDGSVWLVVSTSAYAGIEIPVDLIIADVAGSCGWFLQDVSVLRYLDRVAGQQWKQLVDRNDDGPHLRESLVVLSTTR